MLAKTLTALALAGVVTLAAGCDVEQTEEGRMPDVTVTEGNLPEYDVDAPDVDVKSRETTVTVPDIDVKTKEVPVTVPDVDVTLPDDDSADVNDAEVETD